MAKNEVPYVRPGFLMTHLVNPIMRWTGMTILLTVRGRVSGAWHRTPLGGPFQYAGSRYLVSGRGQTQWARNLRAAGGGQLRVHGAVEPFKAVEVTGPEHDRIVAANRERLRRSGSSYFRRIPDPADHPVFRIEPTDDASAPIAERRRRP